MADFKDVPGTPESAGSPTGEPPSRKKLRAEEKQWGALAHASVVLGLLLPVIGGPLGPLVVRLTKGKDSDFVDSNAVEALNFGILLGAAQLLASVVTGSVLGSSSGGLGGLGSLGTLATFLPLVITLAALVLPGMAALKANQGQPGTYPEAMPRFIKTGDEEEAE